MKPKFELYQITTPPTSTHRSVLSRFILKDGIVENGRRTQSEIVGMTLDQVLEWANKQRVHVIKLGDL
jgi:hypothetical protein